MTTTTPKKSTHKTPRDTALDAGLAAWFGVTAVDPDIAFLRERMSQAIEAALAIQRASSPPSDEEKAALEVAWCWGQFGWTEETRAAIEKMCAALEGKSRPSPSSAGEEAAFYLSSRQLPLLGAAHYFAYRMKPEGNFDTPVYFAAPAAAAVEPAGDSEGEAVATLIAQGWVWDGDQWVLPKRAAAAPEGLTEDNQWIAEAKKTLERLSDFLQAFDVPHAVNWRDWIDNAEKHFTALRPGGTVDVDELRRAIAAIGVVAKIYDRDVIRRWSVLEVIDQRIARAAS